MDPGPFIRFQCCMAKSSSNPEEQLNEIKDGYWITNIGSGKVAGKVLIVDYGVGYAKLLILLDSVT